MKANTAAIGNRVARMLCIAAAALCLNVTAVLRAAETGVITGTVTNKTTGNGLIGAVVEVPALKLTTLVDNTGRYVLNNVPTGTQEVQVSYTSLDTQTSMVVVSATQPAVKDFVMSSSVLMLDAFRVASDKAGAASALTQQRQADNLKNIASMDQLADLPNMNATELAIRLPGVTFADPGDEVVEQISVRGMGAGMTSITIDGGGMSSFSAQNRNTRMTAFTGAMFESLELTKGQTPDRSVDSLGGGVNFKTRSPLSMREKRRVSYSLTARTAPWFTEQVPMRERRRTHELINVSYQEKFAVFNSPAENLAVSVNYFKSENAFGFFRTTRDFQQTNNQPAFLWDYRTQDDYNNRMQQSISTKWDFRITRNNLIKLNLIYNDAPEPMRKRPQVRAFAGGPTTVPNATTSGVEPGWTDRVTVVRAVPTAATATSSTTAPALIDISSEAINRDQRLRHMDIGGEHTWGPIEADWAWLWSRTRYRYLGAEGALNMRIGNVPFVGPNGGPGSATNNIQGPNGETGVGWILDRRASDLYPMFIRNGGLDWSNPAYYRPRLNDGLNSASGNLDVDLIREYRANFKYRLPIERFSAFFKTGASLRDHDVELYRGNRRWNYLGTGPLPTDPNTPKMWDEVKTGRRMPIWEATMFLTNGQPTDPSLWQEDKYYHEMTLLQATNKVTEIITGYYAMTQGKIGRFGFLGGLRHEDTYTEGRSNVRARTLTTAAQQLADPYGSAQKDYNHPNKNKGEYGQNFPSIHAWYDITPNLKARGSWTTGFARPNLNNAVASLSVNDTLQTVSFGNPALRPTKAKNWDFSLEYYFEPSGSFTVGWFHKDINDYIISGQEIGIVPTGPDNGFEGQYSGYTILANGNAGTAVTQGWEVAYQQQFRFLPGPLKGLRLDANFTKIAAHGDYGTKGVYLKTKDVNGFIPLVINARLSWDYKRFSITTSYNWTDASIRGSYNVTNPSRNRYMRSREIVNLNTRYQLTQRGNLTLGVGVANLFNAPQIYYRSIPDQMETFLMQGTTMTVSLEGRF